jgi:hypothetical protein
MQENLEQQNSSADSFREISAASTTTAAICTVYKNRGRFKSLKPFKSFKTSGAEGGTEILKKAEA